MAETSETQATEESETPDDAVLATTIVFSATAEVIPGGAQ